MRSKPRASFRGGQRPAFDNLVGRLYTEVGDGVRVVLTTKGGVRMYDDLNLDLYVASYPDATLAKRDYDALKLIDDKATAKDMAVIASVILSRDAGGEVTVEEHGGAQVAAGATIGGVAGLVV